MCGICGIIDYSQVQIGSHQVERMCSQIRHRGPDDSGIYSGQHVVLGSQRLSIIDVSQAGHMPMSNKHGTLTITFNGEIYNFQELRNQLIKLGYNFNSKTDTETLLYAFEEWGTACLDHCNGMFAFAIWDVRTKSLFCGRDRLGVKPFYYYHNGSQLIFCSEIHPLYQFFNFSYQDISPEALNHYLHFGHTIPEKRFVKQIQTLMPGHYLYFSANGLSTNKYWSLKINPNHSITFRDAQDLIVKNLEKATRLRLVCDVPFGCFLSGGIDSGLVTAFAAMSSSSPVHTFTASFADDNPENDERSLARLVSKRYNTIHTELIISASDLHSLPKIIHNFGEPFSDISAIPMLLLSMQARKYITVALSGDGGDEAFGGYQNVISAAIANDFLYWLPPPILTLLKMTGQLSTQFAGLNKLLRFLKRYGKNDIVEHYQSFHRFTEDFGSKLLAPTLRTEHANDFLKLMQSNYQFTNFAERHIFTDYSLRLPGDYLPKVDICSSLASLEVRSPFLDYNVVETAMQIPIHLKVLHYQQKHLLRTIAERHLPKELFSHPKRGFAPKNFSILSGIIDRFVNGDLGKSLLARSELINPAEVKVLLYQYSHNNLKFDLRLYTLLCLEIWCRLFIDKTLTSSDSL
jgi:asparagine synthase (glutamine-hydrolysing)